MSFQPILGSTRTDDYDQFATEYNTIMGADDFSPNEMDKYCLVSTPGKLKNLYVLLYSSPGLGIGAKSYTFSLRKNGANTALSCQILDLATSCNDTVNEIAVAAGDRVNLKIVPSVDIPRAVYGYYGFGFESDNPNESLLMNNTNGNNLDNANDSYLAPSGNGIVSLTESNVSQVIPTSGTLKNLYVLLNGAPGVGMDYTFTVRRNGVDTGITCAVAGANTTCNDVANSQAVSQGDIISIKCVPSAGPPAAEPACIGLTFEADIDGESIAMMSGLSNISSLFQNYNTIQVVDRIGTYNGIWSNRCQICQMTKVRNLTVWLENAPGAGKSHTVTLHQSVGATPLSVALSGATTAAHNNTAVVMVQAGHLLAIDYNPYNRPAWGLAKTGVVFSEWDGIPPLVVTTKSNASKLVAEQLI